MTTGIALAGGGALLKGLDRLVNEQLNVAVSIAEDPLASVVEGAGKVLDNMELYKGVCS